jgi:hypothetical protein
VVGFIGPTGRLNELVPDAASGRACPVDGEGVPRPAGKV